jgi:hypothetical protein
VAMLLLNLEVEDYDAWKPNFDGDPAGRRESGATSHRTARAVDNPNDVFIRVEFPSVDRAKVFRQMVLDSGALDRPGIQVRDGPVVADVAETVTY